MELKTASKEFLTFPNIPHMAKKTEPAKAGKIKIKKSDIEAGNLELPDGYELLKVNTKAEKINNIDEQITALSIDTSVSPSYEDLAAHNAAGVIHPYYEKMKTVNGLLEAKMKLQK